jgi:hypothetical protein
MGVSGQRHAPAALESRGKDPRYPLYRRLGGPKSRSGHRGYRKDPFASAGDRTSIARPVARHYTDWAQAQQYEEKWKGLFSSWMWGGSSTQAWTPTYVSILSIPQMIWVWRATVEWYIDRGNPKKSEKDLSHCYFVHHKSHMDWPGSEPGSPRWEDGD